MQLLFSVVVAYFAAKIYGPGINVWLWGPYSHQGDFGGYMTAGMAGLLGGAVLWPFVRPVLHDLITSPWHRSMLSAARFYRSQPPLPANAEQVIEKGTRFTYIGLVDRDLVYYEGGKRKGRVQTRFTLERNTMAMPARERAALEIYAKLAHHGYLDAQADDRLRYALAWGDGKCRVTEGKKFTVDAQLAKQNGIRSFKDLITLDAADRDISIDGAITELFNRLQAVAGPNAPADVNDMLRSFQP